MSPLKPARVLCALPIFGVLLASAMASAQQGPPPAPTTAPVARTGTGNTGAPPPLVPADNFNIPPSTPTVRGGEKAQGVLAGEVTPARVPARHTVRRGDTLWDISESYYRNPWMWPKIWSYNTQVQNPHWIYPGDQIRLRNDGGDDRAVQSINGIVNRRTEIPADTVFLRDKGFMDDPRRDVWGVISGSPEDRMLLSEGNVVYIEIKDDHDPKPNQELSIFRPARSAGKGAAVQILGTLRIENFDDKKKIARARITESLDAIERGANVGPIGRRFDIVPPVKNKNDIVARVVMSVYPHAYHVQNQVVFIDKGSDDGIVPGNRLFILRRGDGWRPTLNGTSNLADKRIKDTEKLGPELESARGTDKDNSYPDEIVGELRVLRVREKSSACLVTTSRVELVDTDLAVARKGY